MTMQIINLLEYRKAKAAREVRRVVNDYFAEQSRAMAWWLSCAATKDTEFPPSWRLSVSRARPDAGQCDESEGSTK